MKWMICFILMMVSVAHGQDHDTAYEGPNTWTQYEQFMRTQEVETERQGLSYMVSGVMAALGGLAGYRSAEDSASRGIYALTQTVGLSAMGYGAVLYWNGHDKRSFYRSIQESSLSTEQKTEILTRFLREEKERRENARWIGVATYSLLATINLISAGQEKDPGVRGVLQFVGGVNAVFALGYAFDWDL